MHNQALWTVASIATSSARAPLLLPNLNAPSPLVVPPSVPGSDNAPLAAPPPCGRARPSSPEPATGRHLSSPHPGPEAAPGPRSHATTAHHPPRSLSWHLGLESEQLSHGRAVAPVGHASALRRAACRRLLRALRAANSESAA